MMKHNQVLSTTQLKRLENHKYSCQSSSLLDPILQPWWNFLLRRIPMSLAPNFITIVGLMVNIASALVLILYSPDAKGEPPAWACFLCAAGLFAYQSLDAIDGKQARRTNTSSPLGELFDHGCDSISTMFVALSACISVQIGHHPYWMFFQCFCAMTLFYCAHWQTYVSGTLRFGKIDVTEAQIIIMGIHVISGIFGASIWKSKIGGIEVWYFVAFSTIILGSMSLVQIFSVILAGGVGKNGSTVAGTSVLSPIIPFSMILVPAFIISQKSTEDVFETYPSLYIITFGMVAAKVTNRLVVAHMTKSELEYLDWGLIGPLMLFLNQYFNNFLPERVVLFGATAWCTFDLIKYCSQVCLEICNHLNIHLFKITPQLHGVPAGGPGAKEEHNNGANHVHSATQPHRKQNRVSRRYNN
uniref:diacylglycerol cholinephosphotransferase n=1 Tax=Phlebotomus kandelakii TaxID=1109342 RepID=A0A6B2EL10_9DIPT